MASDGAEGREEKEKNGIEENERERCHTVSVAISLQYEKRSAKN